MHSLKKHFVNKVTSEQLSRNYVCLSVTVCIFFSIITNWRFSSSYKDRIDDGGYEIAVKDAFKQCVIDDCINFKLM